MVVEADGDDSRLVVGNPRQGQRAQHGHEPSHVSATVLTVSSGVNRLVLTSDVSRLRGIELVENGGSSLLSSLGLVSSTLVANTIDGNARSYGFDTSTTRWDKRWERRCLSLGASSQRLSRRRGPEPGFPGNHCRQDQSAGANTASVTTETVNGAVVSRLQVNGTVTANPDDGAPAETVSTADLQQLGFLKNARGPGMQLFAPTDARLVIDGIPIRRSTNVISDASPACRCPLPEAEVGTTVDVTVARDDTAAIQALKDYATAYNGAAAYVATNTAENGPLAFDTAIRSTLRQFTGAAHPSSVSTARRTAAVRRSESRWTRQGVSIDETKLKAALAASPDAVRSLFATNGTSTLPAIIHGRVDLDAAGTYAVA